MKAMKMLRPSQAPTEPAPSPWRCAVPSWRKPPKRAAHAKKRILLVEDDEINREVITSLLVDSEYLVTAVGTGTEAVRWLAEHAPPDLVVLDWLLRPDLSGEEVLHCLRVDPKTAHVPVMVVSAAMSVFQRFTERAPAVHAPEMWLAKPFHVPEFLDAVEGFLSGDPKGGE